MKSLKKAFLFGFLAWLLPFIISFVIFPIRKSNYYLFESVITVVFIFFAVWFAFMYFRNMETSSVREGFLLGALWFAIGIALDLSLFLPKSPMQMSLSLYMSQIGIKYLCIPIITAGFGGLKQRKS